MRFRFFAIAIPALFAGVAFGQTYAVPPLERVLHFTHTESPQGFQEINNIIRSIADIRDVSVDITARTLTLRGTDEQVAAGEWLFKELDQNGVQPATPNSPMHEYRSPGSTDVLRVYYLTHVDTPQGIQEIVNAVRSTTDIQRFFPCAGARAVAIRATADQVAMAEWTLKELDRPAPASGEKTVMHEYRPAGGGDVVAAAARPFIFALSAAHLSMRAL